MALEKVDGVEEASVSYEAGQAVVTYDPERTSPDEFMAELARLTGFRAIVTPAATDSVTIEGRD